MTSHFKRALSSFTEEDFSCPVCQDIFEHPVLLSCSHSFCKACLLEWWRQKEVKECPVCKTITSMDDPPCNLALKNMCETIMGPKLFLRESATIFQDRLNALNDRRRNCEQAAEYIEVQTLHTERKIKEGFKKLHQFLHEEEDARIATLWVEEDQKVQIMKEQIRVLNRDAATLSDIISDIDEELRAECRSSSSFLNLKATAEKLRLKEDPQPVAKVAPIDEAKHLGNLVFSVWDKMKAIVSYTPVILDPSTAGSEYTVRDNTTLIRKERCIPENLESSTADFVTGSEGFESGTHSWDILVGDNKDWEVGVLEGSEERGWFHLMTHGECLMANLHQSEQLPGLLINPPRPRVIRIQLDWDAGKLSFSDADTDRHLHTFTQAFKEKLIPFFYTGDDAVPLVLLPRNLSGIRLEVDQ